MKLSTAIILIFGLLTLGLGLVLAASDPGDGIASEITDVTVSPDKLLVVTFTLKDARGGPLSLEDTQGVRFAVARIEQDPETKLTRYVNYFTQEVKGAEYRFQGKPVQPAQASVSQPVFEAGKGTFAQVKPGVYTYTFGQPLGDGYDPKLTHVVGAEVIRGPRNVAANPVYTFVPAGGSPTTTRVIATTESCDQCHRDLNAHGGSRKRVELCVLCHTSQNVDPETGNTLEFKVMVHRIHSGTQLPSVKAGKPYYVVGFQQTVVNFSTVVWSQDTRNCTTCHSGPDGDRYKTAPNIAACTSCHDNVDPSTGQKHPGKPKTDAQCTDCHSPDLKEFDQESIPGTHAIPRTSESAKGVKLEIVSISDLVPGGSPTVTFKVTNKAGDPIAPEDMDYLAITLAGPTSDYTTRVTETLVDTSSSDSNGSDESGSDTSESPNAKPQVEDAGNGAYSYKFHFVVPQDATGTYAVGMEGYVMERIKGVDDLVLVAAFNPVSYVNLSSGDPAPRQLVVDQKLCNACHKDLVAHGTIRQNVEYCVLCHNPTATDEAQRPQNANPPTSINFRVLIHRIHAGGNAKQPLQVYGFGNQLIDFSNVRFPGDLAACQTCHLPGKYSVLLSDLQPTVITQGGKVVSTMLPVQSVCTSCHDSPAVSGHAKLQTTTDGIETCEVCHGPGRKFDVVTMHD